MKIQSAVGLDGSLGWKSGSICLIAAVFLLFFYACSKEKEEKISGETLKANSLTVTVVPELVDSMEVDESILLRATIMPGYAANKTISWTSNDPSKATVADGLVKALAEGDVIITATASDGSAKSGSCRISIKKKTTNIVITPNITSVKQGDSVKLTAEIKTSASPSEEDNKSVDWKSEDPSIATVDRNGVVMGISEGKTSITVTIDDGNKKIPVHHPVTITGSDATMNNIPVEGIYIVGWSPELLSIEMGKTVKLSPYIFPTDATDKSVVWTSDRPDIVTVDGNGLLTTIAVGTATVTLRANGGKNISDTKTITVIAPPAVLVPDITQYPSSDLSIKADSSVIYYIVKLDISVGEGQENSISYLYSPEAPPPHYQHITKKIVVSKSRKSNITIVLTSSAILDKRPFAVTKVWIDWNGNGDFENTESLNYLFGKISFGTNTLFEITAIPGNAKIGIHRMRFHTSIPRDIRYRLIDHPINPTGDIGNGSVLDVDIEIVE